MKTHKRAQCTDKVLISIDQECARDLLSRDPRPETQVSETKTETFKIFCSRRHQDKTFKIRDETKTRLCSFRDAGRDLEAVSYTHLTLPTNREV